MILITREQYCIQNRTRYSHFQDKYSQIYFLHALSKQRKREWNVLTLLFSHTECELLPVHWFHSKRNERKGNVAQVESHKMGVL